ILMNHVPTIACRRQGNKTRGANAPALNPNRAIAERSERSDRVAWRLGHAGRESLRSDVWIDPTEMKHDIIAMMTLPDLVHRDPKICGGEPVFRGTRVTLRTVLASLADGDSVEQILRSFPTLTDEQVKAVIAFAAASVQEDLPIPELPAVR